MTPSPLSKLDKSRVEDASLADDGARVLEWTRLNMPVLATLRDALAQERPLTGRRIGSLG
jgi:adenosylhomocysteinase